MTHRPSKSRAAFSRRRVLTLGAGLGAGAGLGLAAGYRTPAGEIRQPLSAVEFVAPHYIRPDKIPGAVISDIDGVPPAYARYPSPREQRRSVQRRPGRGGEVSTFQVMDTAPPSPDNPWRRELDKRLGVRLRPNYAAGGMAYPQRLQTLMASGELPDITYVVRQDGGGAPAVAESMRQGAFADLSEILAGPGIDAYPNLARIPTYSWRNSSINGRILGVPGALPLVNEVTMYRTDWASDLGFAKPPADADEVKELLAGYARGSHRGRKAGDTWGLAQLDHGIGLAAQMFRIPNGWRAENDGRLTYEIETDEYEAALAWLAGLWKSGAFHPDATTLPVLEAQSLFMSGRIGLMPAGIAPHYVTMVPTLHKNDPEAEVTPLTPPGHDRGEPFIHQGDGYWGIAAIPAATARDTARLEELLRILDYWCSPFGSEEYTFINYGIEGRHFTYDDQGTPIAVDDSRSTEVIGPSTLVQPREAGFFYPGDTKSAVAAQEAVAEATPLSIPDPTRNLISETDVRRSQALDQLNTDYKYGIITGRRSMREFREWRKRWRSTGGNTIRKEFEAGLA